MRPKRTVIRQTVLTVVAALVFVPAMKAPARSANAETMSAGNYAAMNPALANPNPRLQPKPLKTWVCLSSWYGGDFDGQVTANGEIYDMYAQTAAHPSLPLGSVVRVENLRTHKSAIVRINDRGPYVPGRSLDVSYQVARELGFAHRGVARVRIELLKVPPSKTLHEGN
ncbi:MAG TPA: septal ring lytic transglycosylase RlpA family protein [Candidatus Acidoferrales bacterium]|nr:septal ring lytic transglycosylase RlpA family protein [Candidatus Acidoferrales bacterium]